MKMNPAAKPQSGYERSTDALIRELVSSVHAAVEQEDISGRAVYSSNCHHNDSQHYIPDMLRTKVGTALANRDECLKIGEIHGCDISIKLFPDTHSGDLKVRRANGDFVHTIISPAQNLYDLSVQVRGNIINADVAQRYETARSIFMADYEVEFPTQSEIEALVREQLGFDLRELEIHGLEIERDNLSFADRLEEAGTLAARIRTLEEDVRTQR